NVVDQHLSPLVAQEVRERHFPLFHQDFDQRSLENRLKDMGLDRFEFRKREMRQMLELHSRDGALIEIVRRIRLERLEVASGEGRTERLECGMSREQRRQALVLR